LQALGLEPFAQEGHRIWQLNAVKVPEGIDDLTVRSRLLSDYNIEIGGGLGPVKGQIWRIGTMGYSAQRQNVLLCLAALEHVLRAEGWRAAPAAGVEAALAHYKRAGTDTDVRSDDNLGAGGIGRV